MNFTRTLFAAALIAALTLAACNRTTGGEDRPAQDSNPSGESEERPQPAEQGSDTGSSEPLPANFDIRGGGADAIDAAWAEVGRLDADAPFKITMSESDLEAKLTDAMAERGFSSLTDLDISFQDQQIGVSFTLTLTEPASVSVPATILFDASIDSNGGLALETVRAEAGEVSIPPEMLTAFSEAITQVILGASSSADAAITLTDLFVNFGEMTIRGRVNPT